jgi:hypothetical protein
VSCESYIQVEMQFEQEFRQFSLNILQQKSLHKSVFIIQFLHKPYEMNP